MMLSLLVATFPLQAAASQAGSLLPAVNASYDFVTAWDDAPPLGTFNDLRQVAVDASGNVYVTDAGNNRVQKFGADGVPITAWGTQGYVQGMFHELTAIAVDGSSVYIGNLSNPYAFQKFSTSGEYLTGWNLKYGYTPKGIAVDGDHNVYIAMAVGGGGLVYKYDPSGIYIVEWKCTTDTSGVSDGIAVDPHGYVYVADTLNKKIYKSDLDGNFLTSWSHPFSHDYQSHPQLAVDGDGNVYAPGENNLKMMKYSSNGTLLAQWGMYGSNDGQFMNPNGVAVGLDGSIYVVDSGNNRIQQFTTGGAFIRKWGTLSARASLYRPEGITVGEDGTVFVANTMADQVRSFTSMGVFLAEWKTTDYPSGLGTDGSGNVYVSGPGVPDIGSRTIYGDPYGLQKFTPAGGLLNHWLKCCGEAVDQSDWATGVAVASDGNIYLADTENERVLKLAPDGSYLTQWGSLGSGDGQFNSPEDIALAPDGSVYVVDTFNNRLQKFTPQGGYLAQWGGYGSQEGQFNHPKGVTVDGSGYVYVADVNNHRVQKFDPDGQYVTAWGSQGSGDGQFYKPEDVAVGPDGSVYVADSYNNRIQKFQLPSPDLSESEKRVDKSVAEPGDVLTYTIMVDNLGSLDAPAAQVTDTLPAWTHYNAGSLSASGGACDESGGVITWMGAAQVGVPVTISFAVTLDAGTPKGTPITNTATFNDGVHPALNRSAVTLASPYLVHLPLVIR
jgi:tripartite motif-containing protein 71